MAEFKDRAIVLARLDYSETSQVLVLFARAEGKIRAIAKGIKRSTKTRFSPGADLLELGDVAVRMRTERSAQLATLTEWKQRRSFAGLRERLPRLYAAQYLAQITSHLTEDWDPHPDLHDALVEALSQLCEGAAELPTVLAYQRTLLGEIGLMPQWEACVHCHRQQDLTHFSSLEGGLICRHCEPQRVEKREVGPRTLHCLRGNAPPPAQPSEENATPTADTSSPETGLPVVRGRSSGSQTDRTRQRVSASPPPIAPPPEVGAAVGLLNYHISHLMGRAPSLGTKLMPPHAERIVC
jgi:DNA repair protein RecO (recombination protein O)